MKYLKTNLFMAVMLAGSPLMAGKSIELSALGVYESGIFDEGAAEIVAHDPATQRLFVVNANDAAVDVLDISNPASPTKFGSIDVSSFGGVANSDATQAGIIAIAVENNDNDFGVADIIVAADGSNTLGDGYMPEPMQLGLIDVRTHGLDASNKDKKINIRQWPVKGMYLPDAIASYKVGGKTFLVTANEGDTRAYDGFDEEARIGKLALDPAKFPDAAILQVERNLGFLLTSSTMGLNTRILQINKTN